MALLEIQGLSKSFGGLHAINGLDFHVEEGEVVSVIGPNGAGKTTFFNLVTGMETPDEGSIVFDGQELVGLRPNQILQLGMARTFQNVRLFPAMTVLENVQVGQHARTKAGLLGAIFKTPSQRREEKEIEERAMALLKKFKLDAKADDFAASLSGGQRKLLEMARALMSEPQLVMLDEPMAGVNPALTQSLLDHILDLKDEGMTVLFVEHDMHMVRHIADWVIVMAEGKVVAEGDPISVMKDPAVIDAYLGAHQDVDLGVVTGRYDDGSKVTITAADIEAEGLAELESEDK